MIKDIINANNNVAVGAKEIEILKEHFPACFHNGSFDVGRLKEYLKDKIEVTEEGYELRFLGKNYGRLLASLDTTTVVVPDEEHNSLPENKDSRNIYISGDNLDALKHLQKSYSGSVKCIYIDPPYNTGSGDFVYTDSFNFTVEELASKLSIPEEQATRVLDLTRRGSATHSAWLMFMLPRLLLARDLLAKDGVIFISIDDNEQSNLKLLCDDVFGEENLAGNLIVKGSPKGSMSEGVVGKQHDYLLVYTRSLDSALKGVELTPEMLKEYKYSENGRKYRLLGLRMRGGFWRRTERPNLYYPIYVNPNDRSVSAHPSGNHTIAVYPIQPTTGVEGTWRWQRQKVEADAKSLMGEQVRRGDSIEWDIFQKDFLERENGRNTKIKSILDGKEFNYENGTAELSTLLGQSGIFSYPKPTSLIKYILSMVHFEDGDIVLDFFSGSGTCGDAIMQWNASHDNMSIQYILIQLPEITKTNSIAEKAGYKTIDEIGQARLKLAADKLRKENPLFPGDLGFKHFTLKEPTAQSIEKMERFEPNEMFDDKTLVDEFGVPAILTTWLVRDGYGLTPDVKTLNIAGYELYYIDKHLYVINPNLGNEVVAALLDKYQSEAAFNPQNIVIYGYALSWSELQGLKDSLRVIRDGEKNMRINFDVRY